MQSSPCRGRTTAETRLGVACAPLADELERWLIREVDDFERLTPLQSLVLDAWALLSLAAEGGGADDAGSAVLPDEIDPKTAEVAPIRDMAAASVVVDARRGLVPSTPVVPATGWPNASSSPVEGWATHHAAWALPDVPGVAGGIL